MNTAAYEAYIRSEYRRERNRARRIKQFRSQCFMVILTIVLIIVLVVSYHAILYHASSDTGEVSYKYYTNIEIAYDDTLWSIPEEYAGEEYGSCQEYISEVMAINHLPDESITAGRYLIVPYYSTQYK